MRMQSTRQKMRLIVAALGIVLIGLSESSVAVTLGDPNVTINNGVLAAIDTVSGSQFQVTSQGLRLIRNGSGFIDNYALNATTTFRTSTVSSGSRDINALIIQADGDCIVGKNIGLGTGNPLQPIHVNRDVTGNVRLRIENDEGAVDIGTDGGAYQVVTGGSVRMSVLSNGRVGIGTTNPTQPLDVAGVGRVQILEITGGSDLSEQFNVAAAAETHATPGMVVCIDPSRPGELIVSSKPYDFTVAGIISGAGGVTSGMVMAQHGSIADGAHPVALTGRVYAYVDGSYGAVAPGDLLTTSATPGHAMKASDPSLSQGAILGKAMTPLAAGEKGLVLVLVTLQ